MYIYSDLKDKDILLEPTYTRKHFYKKISIFNDNILDKSISHLRESVEKKKIFIQKYNESKKVLTKKLKIFDDKEENKNNRSRDNSNLLNKNNNFVTNENKRRKKNYSFDFKNIVTIKNMNKDNLKNFENANLSNNNNDLIRDKSIEIIKYDNEKGTSCENIIERIKRNINSDNSYKNLTNLNVDLNRINNLAKSPFRDNSRISENSLDINKILDEFIENIDKVYTIDNVKGLDNSYISNIFFKKIQKKSIKDYYRNNSLNNSNNKISNDENSFFYNNRKKRNKSKSSSNHNDSNSDSSNENNSKNNKIVNSESFISNNIYLNKKEKKQLYNNFKKDEKIEISKDKNSFKVDESSKELIRKINEMNFQNNFLKSPKNININENKNSNNNSEPNNNNLNNLNYSNKKEDPFLDSILEMHKKKQVEIIREKTPQKIKSEFQKIFNTNKNEDFHYKEINKDPESLKKMIIELLDIPKEDPESFKYYREISKNLVVKMKDKVYFWKNIIDYVYSKIFLNKLDHKKSEKRILGEGLFHLNVEDLRYHKNNKKLRLELRNSLNEDYVDQDILEMNERNKNMSNNNMKNNINYCPQNNLKSENNVIDRKDIFRSIQHSNFSANAEKLIKPSTLKKINKERKIKLNNISRNHRNQSQNIFGSNSSNTRFNITNFNYISNLNDEESNFSNINANNFYQYINSDRSKINYSNNNDFSNNYNNLNYNNNQSSNNNLIMINNNNNNKNILNHSIISESIFNSNKKDNFDNSSKGDDKASKRFRVHHHSVDINSDINDISRIHPTYNNQNHLMGYYNNNLYFNSYNNESMITNLENSTNFNITEIDKVNNNKKINNSHEFTENFDKMDTNKKIINLITNSANINNINNENSNKNIINISDKNINQNFNNKENKIKIDKNNFNKINKSLNQNLHEVKNQVSFADVSKVNIFPNSVNYGPSNYSNNHYENYKNNKDIKAFKVVAPMMINSIPRYDL